MISQLARAAAHATGLPDQVYPLEYKHPSASSPENVLINFSETAYPPMGIYPDVIPFANIMMSGIIPKTCSDANQYPNLPKAVTTSSAI